MDVDVALIAFRANGTYEVVSGFVTEEAFVRRHGGYTPFEQHVTSLAREMQRRLEIPGGQRISESVTWTEGRE